MGVIANMHSDHEHRDLVYGDVEQQRRASPNKVFGEQQDVVCVSVFMCMCVLADMHCEYVSKHPSHYTLCVCLCAQVCWYLAAGCVSHCC